MEENKKMNQDNHVKVEDRVTTDLEQTEEAVFEVIALNPSEPATQIQEKYRLSQEKLNDVINNLIQKGFIQLIPEDEQNELVWEVTELGRLMLLKYVEVMRFEIMEAQLREQNEQQVKQLKRKKKAFKNAYKQCKALYE